MILYLTGLAFLAVLLIPIAILFLTLINLVIEDVKGTAKVSTSRVSTYKTQDIPTSPLRVVK